MLGAAGIVPALHEDVGENQIEARQAMLRIEPRPARALFSARSSCAGCSWRPRRKSTRRDIRRHSAPAPSLSSATDFQSFPGPASTARPKYGGRKRDRLRWPPVHIPRGRVRPVGVEIARSSCASAYFGYSDTAFSNCSGASAFFPFQKMARAFKRLFRIPRRLQRRDADLRALDLAETVQHERSHVATVENMASCQRDGIR